MSNVMDATLAGLMPNDEERKARLFNDLPYAGNHVELGTPDGVSWLCVFYVSGEPFYFTRDESWDNVDYVETAVGERERSEMKTP